VSQPFALPALGAQAPMAGGSAEDEVARRELAGSHPADQQVTVRPERQQCEAVVEQVEDPKKAKGLVRREVVRVVTVSKLRSSYRVRLRAHGQGLEWVATEPRGEVIFTVEPETTLLMRLKNTLLGPFVPEQLL